MTAPRRGLVTFARMANNIWFVQSLAAQMLTKRRAVDYCRVATAICMRSALPLR
jgi:hypothetical protein